MCVRGYYRDDQCRIQCFRYRTEKQSSHEFPVCQSTEIWRSLWNCGCWVGCVESSAQLYNLARLCQEEARSTMKYARFSDNVAMHTVELDDVDFLSVSLR